MKEAWPGHRRLRRRDQDPPDPPRRLHRRPRRACSPTGMVQRRPQAGDRRGQGRPLRPHLRERQHRRGRPGRRRRRHQVGGAPAAVQRPAAGVLRRARLPRGDLRRRRPRAWSSTTTCGCTSAGARRSTCCRCATATRLSFDVTALNPDGTWTPKVTKDDLLATVEGFDERIVTGRARPRHGHASTSAPSTTSTRSTRGTPTPSSLIGDAAHAMLPPPGPGRELGDHGRRRSRRRPGRGGLRHRRRWPCSRRPASR